MTRKTWEQIKTQRTETPARRGGYEKAGRAIRLAMEIRALREKRGLTQRELAERLGTTAATTPPSCSRLTRRSLTATHVLPVFAATQGDRRAPSGVAEGSYCATEKATAAHTMRTGGCCSAATPSWCSAERPRLRRLRPPVLG